MFKKIKEKKILLVLLLALMVGGSVGIGYYFATNHQKEADVVDDQDAELGIIPGMSQDQIQEKLNMVVAEGMANIGINTNPIFENGNSSGNLRIENVSANHYAYIVKISLDDTNEMIYQSGRIKPGYYIENAKLGKHLSKGEYLATASFTAYTVDDNKQVGVIAVKMKIGIQN